MLLPTPREGNLTQSHAAYRYLQIMRQRFVWGVGKSSEKTEASLTCKISTAVLDRFGNFVGYKGKRRRNSLPGEVLSAPGDWEEEWEEEFLSLKYRMETLRHWLLFGSIIYINFVVSKLRSAPGAMPEDCADKVTLVK